MRGSVLREVGIWEQELGADKSGNWPGFWSRLGTKLGLRCLPAIPLLPEPLPPSAFLPLEGLRQVVLVVFLPSPHSHPNLTQGAKEDLPARARLGTFCGSGAPLSCPPQQSVIPFKSQDLSPCEHASGRFCGGRGPCPPGTPGRRVPD